MRSRSVLASGTTGQVSDTVKGTGHSKFALSILNQLNVFDKQSYPLDIESMAVLMKGNLQSFKSHLCITLTLGDMEVELYLFQKKILND